MGPGLGLLSGRGRPLRGMNILKLWDWATSDLLDLGAKHLLPSFLSYMDRDVVLGNGHGCLLGEAVLRDVFGTIIFWEAFLGDYRDGGSVQ